MKIVIPKRMVMFAPRAILLLVLLLFWDGSAQEAGEIVCVVASFAFVLGLQVGIVRNAQGTFRILQILVFGFFTKEGFEASTPRAFFTLGEVDEEFGLETFS